MRIFLLTLIIQIGLVSAIYVQASPTALVKGAEGMSPTDYYELSQEAEQSFARRDYAKAAASFERLTKAYPFDDEMWYLLGRSRYENKVRNLIVDVRRNNGGNTYFYRELLRTLTNFDAQDGNKLFVIGRRTFSATANFITDIDRMTNAVFVGEPSSGKPITVGGDLTDMSLPYSRLQLGIAGASWKLTSPRDTRLWFAPEVPVELNAKDYFANRNPVLDAIMVIIRH